MPGSTIGTTDVKPVACPCCGCDLRDHFETIAEWENFAFSGDDPYLFQAARDGACGPACKDCDCMHNFDCEHYSELAEGKPQ